MEQKIGPIDPELKHWLDTYQSAIEDATEKGDTDRAEKLMKLRAELVGNMTTEIIDMHDEDHCCECAVCGGHRSACSYPPVCPNCRAEWEIETNLNQRAISCPYCHAPDTGRETCEQCGKKL